jgi:hypothetical protein
MIFPVVYLKAFAVGTGMFVLALVLFVVISMAYARHRLAADVPALVGRTHAAGEVGFEMRSEWIDIRVTDGVIAGAIAFIGGVYWTLRRNRGATM